MEAEYLIIGGGVAAARAVQGIRALDPRGRLVLVTAESDPPYFRPLISYLLGNKVGEEALLWRRPEFWRANSVELFAGRRAVRLDPAGRAVTLENGEELRYRKLLLATGSRPIVLPVPGRDLPGVFTFTTWQDVRALRDYFKGRRVERAVIIGGGLIGLKAGEGLAALGVRVSLVELQDHLLPAVLDREGGEVLARALAQEGWEFFLGRRVVAVNGEAAVNSVTLDDGTELAADLVIMAAGVRPNAELAKEAGLAVQTGIIVDTYLETSQAGIYAAGDVAEGEEALSGQKRVLALWPVAGRQGYTAGLNMAGGGRACAPGIAMNATSVAGLSLVTVGLSLAEAEDGYTVVKDLRAENFFYRKLVFRDDRLVGAILVGEVARAGVLTGLIRSGVALPGGAQEMLRRDIALLDLPAAYREELFARARQGNLPVGGGRDAA